MTMQRVMLAVLVRRSYANLAHLRYDTFNSAHVVHLQPIPIFHAQSEMLMSASGNKRVTVPQDKATPSSKFVPGGKCKLA